MKKIFIITPFLLFMTSCFFAPVKKSIKTDYDIPADFIGMKELSGTLVDADAAVPEKWWKVFNDDNLNTVVNKVINNNLDLKLAASRMELVQSQFKMSRARRLPSVNVNGSYSKSEAPQMSISPNPANPGTIVMGTEIKETEKYSLRTGLLFEIDIWGRLRNTSKAALAELYASKADLQAAYLGMVSQAIILYYDMKAAKMQTALAQKNLSIYKTNMDIQKRKYQKGIGSKLNIERTIQALEGSNVQFEKQKLQLSQKEHLLAVLMGEYPKTLIDVKAENSILLPGMPVLPKTLPSTIIKKRPDIIAAEYRVESARQSVGAARANLFPRISLSLGYGYAADAVNDLFSPDALAKSIGVDLAQTLFAGGSKLAAISQKKTSYKMAILNYKKTLLNAFKEIEDILARLKAVKKQKKAMEQQKQAAEDILNETEIRYLKGLYPYDKLLDAEKNYFNTQSALINMNMTEITTWVQYYKAIGI